MGKSTYLTKLELKYNTLVPLLSSGLLLLILYFIFGTQNLDEKTARFVVERFLPFMGIILLTSLYEPEQGPTKDLLLLHPVALLKIYSLRLFLRVLLYVLLLSFFLTQINYSGYAFSFLQAFLHSFAIGLCLGGLGLLLFAVSGNIVLAYLLTSIYLLSQWFIGKGVYGPFYLYTLQNFSWTKVLVLLFLAVFFIGLSFPLWSSKES